ncbi:MAG TPA: hypothetical protein PLV59_04260 [Candidatus Dojkabacteria bacterium]|nr:hypothetical protein [Candidatus Dojkabacteria bacterium]
MSTKSNYLTSIRISFFIVYAWFGLLKVFDVSGATNLVQDLLNFMLPGFPEDLFVFLFGLFEVLIGIIFLYKPFTKLAIFFATVHLMMCAFPLFVLPYYTWNGSMILTQVGQYIVKNIFIVSALIGLWETEVMGK